MKFPISLFLVAAILSGCEDLGLKDEKFEHQVIDVSKDDYFVISNKKKPVFARFTVDGRLSHDAKILWSGSEPAGDTAFSVPNEILLPKGKVHIVDAQGDYYGQKLYVKYVSSNDSTAGNLRIKIRM